MNAKTVALSLAVGALCVIGSAAAFAQALAASGPYHVLKTVKVGGEGGWDYLYADSADRQFYVPRGNRIDVYDLDTLKQVGTIADTNRVHDAAVDPATGNGFCSSSPVVEWNSKTLKTIKTIPVQGRPDGLLFDPATERVFVLSHSQPNATVIDAKDGTVVGTIDLGGAPEQGASDGAGHLYFNIEDKDNVAVVDAKTLKVTGHYDLAGKGGGPAGFAMDVKNHILFSFCHNPATCVILNADDGKILATLPIGSGVDAGSFNPKTMEAFSSQGDGTLTVIKENSPTDFTVEQTVKTMAGARTSTLDEKTGNILLVAAEYAPRANRGAQPRAGGRGRGRGGRGAMVPDSFTVVVVGK